MNLYVCEHTYKSVCVYICMWEICSRCIFSVIGMINCRVEQQLIKKFNSSSFYFWLLRSFFLITTLYHQLCKVHFRYISTSIKSDVIIIIMSSIYCCRGQLRPVIIAFKCRNVEIAWCIVMATVIVELCVSLVSHLLILIAV